MNIRNASPDDDKTLARLNYTVQKLHVERMPQRYKATTPDDALVIATFQRFLCDEKSRILIAEVDGEAVGYIHVKITQTEENAFVLAHTTLHIDQMSVVESHQGQGIGHALMEQAFVLARQLDIELVTLGVVAFNTNAQKFYERHGFEFQSMRMIKNLGVDAL